jgi:hypothetical protein
MSLVFAGVCRHAPCITGRPELADPALPDQPRSTVAVLNDQG